MGFLTQRDTQRCEKQHSRTVLFNSRELSVADIARIMVTVTSLHPRNNAYIISHLILFFFINLSFRREIVVGKSLLQSSGKWNFAIRHKLKRDKLLAQVGRESVARVTCGRSFHFFISEELFALDSFRYAKRKKRYGCGREAHRRIINEERCRLSVCRVSRCNRTDPRRFYLFRQRATAPRVSRLIIVPCALFSISVLLLSLSTSLPPSIIYRPPLFVGSRWR